MSFSNYCPKRARRSKKWATLYFAIKCAVNLWIIFMDSFSSKVRAAVRDIGQCAHTNNAHLARLGQNMALDFSLLLVRFYTTLTEIKLCRLFHCYAVVVHLPTKVCRFLFLHRVFLAKADISPFAQCRHDIWYEKLHYIIWYWLRQNCALKNYLASKKTYRFVFVDYWIHNDETKS